MCTSLRVLFAFPKYSVSPDTHRNRAKLSANVVVSKEGEGVAVDLWSMGFSSGGKSLFTSLLLSPRR
jgi:hypothetical protein